MWCAFLDAHTHALSQDSKIFAGWKPIPLLCSLNGPVPFLLFRPTCTAGGDSILPVVSHETLLDTVSLSLPILPPLSATATVSNCFLLSCFSFFLPSPPHSSKLSSVVHFPAADKWSALMNTRRHSEDSHPEEIERKSCVFLRIFFLMKHKKAIKLR